MSTRIKPSYCQELHLTYLDRLRKSGKTNMWGAGEYLENAFGFSRAQAKEVLLYWMDTFTIRHPNGDK